MYEKAKLKRDAFAFSLGGMRTIASFVPAQAVADDRINRILDERLNRDRDEVSRLEDQNQYELDFVAEKFARKWSLWPRSRKHAA